MISFAKADGQWVLKVAGETVPQPGQTVTVTKRNGQTSTVTVTEHMCLTDGDVTLVSFTESRPQSAGTRRPTATQILRAAPRTASQGRCRACGRTLTDSDRRASCAPGFHPDCA